MNVLLLAPWVPASLAFARSLRRKGIATFLVQTLTTEFYAPRTFSALEGHALLPRDLLFTAQGLEQLRKYALSIDACAVVALTDAELLWLARNQDAFGASCRVLVQNPESLSYLLSKLNQVKLAQ